MSGRGAARGQGLGQWVLSKVATFGVRWRAVQGGGGQSPRNAARAQLQWVVWHAAAAGKIGEAGQHAHPGNPVTQAGKSAHKLAQRKPAERISACTQCMSTKPAAAHPAYLPHSDLDTVVPGGGVADCQDDLQQQQQHCQSFQVCTRSQTLSNPGQWMLCGSALLVGLSAGLPRGLLPVQLLLCALWA